MKTCFSRLALPVCLLALGWLAGLRVNLTDSVPVGLYRETRDCPASHGEFVSFCLESDVQAVQASRYLQRSLLCPNGLQPLLKRLAALPGDVIEVHPKGLSINGQSVPESGALTEDSKGRALISCLASGPVPEGMALVLGDRSGSFDGRYFGVIPLRSCRRVVPIITF